MPKYEHKELVKTVSRLDQAPPKADAYSEWIESEAHVSFLRMNASANDLVVLASGRCTFVHTMAVPNDLLAPVDQQDLLSWSISHCGSIASYVSGGGREDVWVERGPSPTGSDTLDSAVQLVFGRTFEGWAGPGSDYFELHQEYAHLAGIHWRPEERAYCRFDDKGDLDPVVSVTGRADKGCNIDLVSFSRKHLERYLAASNASLIRMFDFTLLRHSEFNGWPKEPPQLINESPDLFYHQKVMPGHAAYTRGVQIVRPRRSSRSIFSGMMGIQASDDDRKHIEFVADDWRNKCVRKISTGPAATTNYFDAKNNTLPYELSPAFFRAEVLLKYKGDRDKYTVGERDVFCRTAWHLEAIDVNEAGQVFAYICYLRRLPYEEQLHWLSFNEAPKAGISERAVANDFKGEFVSFVQPLQAVLSIVRRWHEDKVDWWILRDEEQLNRVNTPLTGSRDEWAEAFLDLAKLVIEGFETKAVRARLDRARVPYEKDERTIALLEKVSVDSGTTGADFRLAGLRTVQRLRSKAKGHASGTDARQLAQDALTEHETFANHFQHVCANVAGELEDIEERML